MGDWNLKRHEMDAALKSRAIPLLRKMGFKGSYPHFRRVLEKRVDTIGFQFSQLGPQFYIEIGVADPDGYTLLDGTHFPPETLKYYQCPVRVRIGELPFNFDERSADSSANVARNSIDAAESEWETLYLNYRKRAHPKENPADQCDPPKSPVSREFDS
jgi:hypothetical protein